MATLIVRRMRVLRARAQRLAAKRRHIDIDGAPFDAEFSTESRRQRPPTEDDRDATSVVDLDLNDGVTNFAVASLASVQQSQQA